MDRGCAVLVREVVFTRALALQLWVVYGNMGAAESSRTLSVFFWKIRDCQVSRGLTEWFRQFPIRLCSDDQKCPHVLIITCSDRVRITG